MASNTIPITEGTFTSSAHSNWKMVSGSWASDIDIHDTTSSGDGTTHYHTTGVIRDRISFAAVVEPGDLALRTYSTTATFTLATGHTIAATFTIRWRIGFRFNDGKLLLTGSGISNGTVTYTPPA